MAIDNMNPLRVCSVVGARPNFIKMASLLHEMGKRPAAWKPILVHTGQHYSPEMSQSFFDDLDLPQPDEYLGLGGGSHAQQTAEIMKAIEGVLTKHAPDLLLVVGDVNSTLAASLVAAKLHIPVAHVEAGLRSFDRRMPEEINRLVTDAISDYLFASEPSGVENLLREGADPDRVFHVGNTMIDTLLRFRERAGRSDALQRFGLTSRQYTLATLHRPSNVDDPEQLRELCAVLRTIAAELPLLLPLHPRTQQRLSPDWLEGSKIWLVPPQGYLDFLHLMSNARMVITDSGGIQEETTVLGVPCVTLRENTERPVTITEGTNVLAGNNPEDIRKCAAEVLGRPFPENPACPSLWDGRASERILDILEKCPRRPC
jgi:UDP-N-acetylglucosamine 2-epimerase (non-hydrolysing)